MKKFGFALFAIFAGATAAVAAPVVGDVCILVNSMQDVFKTLRTLAFIGSAFLLAGWAWDFIKGGTDEKVLEGLKGKGIALLVGFTILFSIGLILEFIGPVTGCVTSGWGL